MSRPRRRAATRIALAAGGLAAVATGVLSLLARQDDFPHAEHAGLFPTCQSCHAGIAADDTAAFVSITPEECAACHDGGELPAVAWAGYERPESNLAFSHVTHAAELREEGTPAQDCVDCHATPGAEVRMAVQRPVAGTCLACHAPAAESHFDVAAIDCATCHRPLAATALASERIADLPQPDTHAREDFLFAHGAIAEAEGQDCSVCHARESCERCHLNADRLDPVAALPRDARVAALVVDRPGEWPVPPSHREPDWLARHGAQARASIEGCANCHGADGCAACHMGDGRPAVIARLPSTAPGRPAGVVLAGRLPAGHSADFVANHGTAAALGTPDCASCHEDRQCQACHDGVGRPGFHPIDFVVRHAPEAFANDLECAACHSREGFCRECHQGLGLAATRSGSAAFHDAVPDWLLAHGAAARQDLEACTTCHQQGTCLRCHSAKAGLRVSPHGPGFDPDRVAGRSTQSCAICHFDLPSSGGPALPQ
jgi:doubled CXXCH motif protein